MQTITLPQFSDNPLSVGSMLTIEPIVVAPDRLVRVLQKLHRADWPVSLLELQRLGVPRYVTRWLMEFANDIITEQELVKAFVLHLINRSPTSISGSDFLRRLWSRETMVLNDPALSTEERLALHSINSLAGPLTESWLDLTGTDALRAIGQLA